MAFTAITVTENFLPDAPGGPIPTGEVVFTLSERIHDGAGDELAPEPIAAALEAVITVEANGATAGTFTLTWNGLTTTAIAYDATEAVVLAALQALAGFPAGATATGGPVNSAPVVVTVPENPAATITADFAGLTGGTNTVASEAAISVVLNANDAATTVPVGSYYTVQFYLAGVAERTPITVTVPHTASGATCTLASLS